MHHRTPLISLAPRFIEYEVFREEVPGFRFRAEICLLNDNEFKRAQGILFKCARVWCRETQEVTFYVAGDSNLPGNLGAKDKNGNSLRHNLVGGPDEFGELTLAQIIKCEKCGAKMRIRKGFVEDAKSEPMENVYDVRKEYKRRARQAKIEALQP